MSDSKLLEELSGWTTWHGTQAPAPVSKHEAQGTALPEQDTIPVEPDHKHGTVVPKRNHNRRPESTCKGRLPLLLHKSKRLLCWQPQGTHQAELQRQWERAALWLSTTWKHQKL